MNYQNLALSLYEQARRLAPKVASEAAELGLQNYEGGATSLAVYGPKNGGGSRIGAWTEGPVILNEVKSVLFVSKVAEQAFDRVLPCRIK